MQSYLRENIEPQFELMIQSASMVDWVYLFLPFLLGLLQFIKPSNTRAGFKLLAGGMVLIVPTYGFIKAYQTADITFLVMGWMNLWIVALILNILDIKDLGESSEQE